MLRRVLTVRTALPLLLCLAMAALWVRSAWREDWVVIRAGQWRLIIGSDQGVTGAALRTSRLAESTLSYQVRRHRRKVYWFRFIVDADDRGVLIALPHWVAC